MSDNKAIWHRIQQRIDNMTVEEYTALYEEITANYPPPSCGTCLHSGPSDNVFDDSLECNYNIPISVPNPQKQRMDPNKVNKCPCWINKEL